jgi:hypothetical protein
MLREPRGVDCEAPTDLRAAKVLVAIGRMLTPPKTKRFLVR